MKMGTAQKQNIAIQHRYFRTHGGYVRTQKPVSFEKWFLNGIRTFEAKGAEFELLPGMVKIQWPGKVAILRTVEDFKREYESCYLTYGITA
jgi:hypothetical protein